MPQARERATGRLRVVRLVVGADPGPPAARVPVRQLREGPATPAGSAAATGAVAPAPSWPVARVEALQPWPAASGQAHAQSAGVDVKGAHGAAVAWTAAINASRRKGAGGTRRWRGWTRTCPPRR